MSTNSKKRRASPGPLVEEYPEKRVKVVRTNTVPSCSTAHQPPSASSSKSRVSTTPSASKPQTVQNNHKNKLPNLPKPVKKCVKINKLAAPKPFPAVAASASATGPRSAHKEGKNYICLTRKTSLGAYMRRCKNLVINDGYKIFHLHAAGAAIPLLLQLACALPPILPFSRDEIHTDISTGTVEVQDEIIPEDEDEDLAYRTRGKSTLYIIFRIGDGQPEKEGFDNAGVSKPKPKLQQSRPKTKKLAGNKEMLVYEEPEQEPEGI